MTALPRTAQAVDFLCDHTPSKSRVMALLDHDHGPRSLAAVLTCKEPDHAHEAVDVLRRVLARREATCADDELRALTAVMPDASAGSLRQAVTHAATGTWPTGPGVLYEVVEPEDLESDGAQDAATVPFEPSSHPPLKDLPGKVVRIARLYEFHVTDEDALIRAATDRAWEPLPATDLGDDDPRDLVGAVMTLTDDLNVPGAQTLEDQSVAEVLSPEDGTNSPTGTRPRWRSGSTTDGGCATSAAAPLPRRRHRTSRRCSQSASATAPTVGRLRDLRMAADPSHCCPAALLSTALSILADQAFDDAARLGDQYLPDAHSTGWAVFDRLPPLTRSADHRWRRRMPRAFDDLADDLNKGRWPETTCTAEEMALHLAIEDAPTYLEDRLADDEHHTLPRHEDDYSWDACSDLLFQDHDVLMLFDASLAGIEAPGNPANQRLGAGDLRVDSWFEPFGNGVARNPQRGFRR